jgi:hypothetical protein
LDDFRRATWYYLVSVAERRSAGGNHISKELREKCQKQSVEIPMFGPGREREVDFGVGRRGEVRTYQVSLTTEVADILS